jgi:diguanylate cyclase (GGDEF)-like protein
VESRDSGAFAEITLPYGRGVSGWVAQNGHPLRNVDPELELAGIDINDHKYHAILSVPLTFDGKTAGVISLYSDKRDFYQERHQDLLVKLAGMVAPGLVNAVKSEEMAAGREPPDELTGLDGVHAMKRYFETDLTGRPQADAYSLYLLDLRDLHAINQRYGHDTGNRLLQALADAITAVLRPEDRCFRYGGDEFAIIAHGADKPGAAVLAGRVRRAVSRLGVKITGNVLSPSVSVGHASYPDDGITPDELWRVADGNLYKDRLQVSPTFAGTPEAAQG